MGRIPVVIILLSLSGCTGTLGAILNRPVDSDHLDEPKEPNKLKGYSGDRRLIRIHRANPGSDVYEICAETQADAIAAFTYKGDLSLTGRGEVKDETSQLLTQTTARGQISDVVRHLEWHTCNAMLNGWITKDQFYAEIVAIRSGAFDVLKPAPVKPETPKPAPPKT